MRGRLHIRLAAGEEGDAGTAVGTQRLSTSAFLRDVFDGDMRGGFLAGTIMFGLRIVPSSATRAVVEIAVELLQDPSVTSAQRSMSWPPSISTSGSTIGTMPASWHSAA